MGDWEKFEVCMAHSGLKWRELAAKLGYTTATLSRVKQTGKASTKLLTALTTFEQSVDNADNCIHKNSSSLVKDPPGSDHAPPACDIERLDRLEQVVTELTKTMREQNEAMLANVNAMNTVLLRLLAEQETGDNKDSNGLAG